MAESETLPPGREAVHRDYLRDQEDLLAALRPAAMWSEELEDEIGPLARKLAAGVREAARHSRGLDAYLGTFELSSREGVLLMCLAEALLRIPDPATADRLIEEKLATADWERHLGESESLFVNASTWGLLLTGRLVAPPAPGEGALALLRRLVRRLGEPVVRSALREAMRLMSRQFVLGEEMADALERARREAARWECFSFDMLGEAVLTAEDARACLERYRGAIVALAEHGSGRDGISVKLSGLHPRFELAQRARLRQELLPRLRELALLAREAGIPLTIDAEEAARLEPTLDLFEALCLDPALAGWEGLGVVVQAYQRRGMATVRWLADLARRAGHRIPVRLVKGAYWDTEIKLAQQAGLEDFPVFVGKAATDVSYLACADALLAGEDAFLPQFATHNAHTAAAVAVRAGRRGGWEFQRLHGMGEALYEVLNREREPPIPVRVYAPVGGHRELLPYLVRRLLENGANTSFLHQAAAAQVDIETLVASPLASLAAGPTDTAAARVRRPADIHGDWRAAPGINLDDPLAVADVEGRLAALASRERECGPATAAGQAGEQRQIRDPACPDRVVGRVRETDAHGVAAAVAAAAEVARDFAEGPVEGRAGALERAAEGLEAAREELLWLVVREAGRCLRDAVAELREAADFCRYYAWRARRDLAERILPGPVGERNRLRLRGRGPMACISPWNFPLSIFTGQVAAALAAGNPVLAKPAHQTPLTAARVCRVFHEAGFPEPLLQLLPGSGSVVGAALVADPRIRGVLFTGSTATARGIQRALAGGDGPLPLLVAETGGVNAMIVDSSALPEQVVRDVVRSAFNSAGQRCSALRVLFLQEEIADRVCTMLAGALAELRLGDPMDLATDCGPVIDAAARDELQGYIETARSRFAVIGAAPAPRGADGWFVRPHAFAIESLADVPGEVFGPVLHVARFAARDLDRVVDAINASGWGLTAGIHTRLEARAERLRRRLRVGNVYLNRDMIGAMVGTQPFGGEGLSGTGPKAGGPGFLPRLAVEQVYTENTAALGGDPWLLGGDQRER